MIETPSFVVPDLRAIDTANAQVVACWVWQDERPFRGLAGLIDWRLAGRLGALAKAGFLTGERDEVLLMPCAGKLPFDKLLVLGLGSRASFNEDVARGGVARLAKTLEGLSVKKTLVELPGRSSGELDPERALQLLPTGDQAWTLVDTEDAEKAMKRRTDARPRPEA